ncbi:hypothetical protein [Botrimarina sp.]|uniref:hypothetical protein n=1 Tax=Botrimarina sp. TaxID=2795802 RepID=UPI0032EB30B2
MKEVHISDELYDAIAATGGDVSAFIERAGKQAIQRRSASDRSFDVHAVRERFRALEGMFGGATLKEVLADRKLGRE